MHPNLSEHLHTEECNIVIRALLKCRENKFGKFFGQCNDLDRALNRCLKQEREDTRRLNKTLKPKVKSHNPDTKL